jgi:hypothetical protein
MPMRGFPESGKKMVVNRVVTKSAFWISGFLDSGGLLSYSQNMLIVVPPAFLHNITTTTTPSDTDNADGTNSVNDIRQHISHDGNKGVDPNGQ